ncbi:hypothetical protein ACFY1A_46225 [Streptomyces sp. NPDC001520]|uniref:hypothetical protein n=1 Tax=Streptomyces sp. NPDC001520 TaxID=3364581 RepID=UPI0036C59231
MFWISHPEEHRRPRPPAYAKAHAADGRQASTKSVTRNGNTAERAINRLEHAKAVATRYNKRRCLFLGTVTAEALAIRLRT